MLGHRLFCTNGNYEDYLNAVQPLRQDSICRKLFGYTYESTITEEDRKNYIQQQELFTRNGYFDATSGLWVYIEHFDKTLQKINCPVLALFGENDSQVDWRKTKKLYEATIGTNPNAVLTIKTFENCNHSLQKCITCGYQEDLSTLKWQACDSYYDTIINWLRSHNIID
ncbi:MAG: dienelactone hydrolase family protein [Saprospiraceae bacterium]|nr:dienelactone hydrolase family protein [Saprospiraceae bacterium]